MAYSFQAKVVARGHHVYKNTTWDEARCGDKVNSGTYSERNLPTCLFLPEREKRKKPRYITYIKNEGIRNFILFPRL